MTRRSRSPTIRPPARSPWSISRSRSASSRFTDSQPGGLEADGARLVALRSFRHLGALRLAHRNPPHCAACGHSRRELGKAVERRLADRLHPRTLRIRCKRGLGRFRDREPHHRARGSLLALHYGSWAALALRAQGEAWSRSLGLLFFIPSAVPSVSVGLGRLVAFSQRPLLLNGTTGIVIRAHFVLISAFSFGNVSAGLARLSPDYEEVASSLGARPTYRLFKVTLPLIAPYLIAAFGLSFALSMGELGATVMVYPPGWVTLPVAIFGLTDRGDIFSGAALTMILVAATLALLIGLERLPLGAVGRRP